MSSRIKLCFLSRDVDLSVMYKIEFPRQDRRAEECKVRKVPCMDTISSLLINICIRLNVCSCANFKVSQKLKYPDTSNWAEGVSVHASALELSRNLASSPSVQWSCSPFPFFNCQPRFYTLMQIKHINPFHLVGVGMKHCKKAKQTKGFPDQTLYTLKSPKTCLFWWDFENIWTKR